MLDHVLQQGEREPHADQKFLITFKPQVWNNIVDRIDRVYDLISKGMLPERTESIKCKFCPWSGPCDPQSLKQQAVTNIRRAPTLRTPKR